MRVSELDDSLWPLLLLAPFLGWFAARCALYTWSTLRGRALPLDADMQRRGASPLLGPRLRQGHAWALLPLERALTRARVRPNALTLGCFALSLVAGVCIALGAVTLGGVLGLLGSSLDYFDGRIARRAGTESHAGAFLDSTLDRCSEIAFLGGAALLFRDAPWTLTACLLALGAGNVVSYTRAKAESLGVELASGLMQRAERVLLFCAGACLGAALDPLLPEAWQGQRALFSVDLWLLALLSTSTAASRTLRGYASLRRAVAPVPRIHPQPAPSARGEDEPRVGAL